MRIILFIVVCLSSLSLDAQVFYRRSEVGGLIGASNYFGDLNPDYGFKSPSYATSIFYKYNFSRYISVKASATYANIGADDKNSLNVFQKQRNLNFKSNIYEFSTMFEFSFFEYTVQDFDARYTPYVTIGLAAFHHDPYTYFEGRKVLLRPLGTEGQKYAEYQDRVYKNNAMAFPFGIGFKFWLSKGLTFYSEIVQRSTLTDYLDDVSTTYVGKEKFIDIEPTPYPIPSASLQDRSLEVGSLMLGEKGRQRGVSTTNDKYMLLQVGVSVRLPTYKCPDDF